jgi:hypothetical protein
LAFPCGGRTRPTHAVATVDGEREVGPRRREGGLAGQKEDGTVYLSGDDGYWHWIPDGATFKALGLDWWSIVWYDGMLDNIGYPLPSLAPPSAPPQPPTATIQPPVARAPAGATVVLTPVIGKPAMAAAAVAGKGFTVSFPVTCSDNGAKLTGGTAIANSSIGGKAIKHVTLVSKGSAAVRLTIPSTGKGKLLKVLLTVKVGSASASRLTTIHIA